MRFLSLLPGLVVATGLVIAAGLATGVGPGVGASMAHSLDHAQFGAGEPGDADKPARAVTITMHETGDGRMIFSPDTVTAKPGEQIRFEIKNAGASEHEFMLDTVEHNARHKEAMEKNPRMKHDDPNGKRLDPGQSAGLVWRFTKPGTFEYACLIPGHFEAGMHGSVFVK
jgi:uncharacterized cupredoxin-like copper-binding protein